MIKMTWERGELDDLVEGVIVESNSGWAQVGERAVIEFDVSYGSFIGQPRPEASSGPVIRFPDQGNNTHRIPYPTPEIALEPGQSSHLIIELD